MLVIHEDILTKVMVAHFLLFCVNIFWLIFFAFWSRSYAATKFCRGGRARWRLACSTWCGAAVRVSV